MNVKRKNGKILSKTGWMRNTLLGIVNFHSAFSRSSNCSRNIVSYLSDENTRKSVKAARLEAERWNGEARKLRLQIA